jgi:hypothetical protein
MCIYVDIQHPHDNKKIWLHTFVHGQKLDLKTTSWSLREKTFTTQKQIKLKKKDEHWKCIGFFSKLKAMMVRTSKNKWKRFKKTLIRMERKLWNSKTQLYGMLHKEAQNWTKVLEGENEFEFMYYIYYFKYASIATF